MAGDDPPSPGDGAPPPPPPDKASAAEARALNALNADEVREAGERCKRVVCEEREIGKA